MADEAILYAIPGSHACMTGELMLKHKGIPYRRVDFVPGTHSMRVRMKGFPGRGEERKIGDRKPTPAVALGDRLGTVPAIRIGEERVQTNRAIARRLDELEPEPPLFPADPELRAEVEAAELWGDETFQMVARRLTLAASLHDPDFMHERGAEGPLGWLLFRNDSVRRFNTRNLARFAFTVDEEAEAKLLAELPAMLDRIDAWIADGVLGGETLNAADYMILTSVALIWYRRDLGPEIESRPVGGLVARALPLPAAAPA